eukprot:m.71932 g.71932  ORF g.71932 m.71932 type:complete len:245 (+) comp20201_c0_seq1:3-737(+)
MLLFLFLFIAVAFVQGQDKPSISVADDGALEIIPQKDNHIRVTGDLRIKSLDILDELTSLKNKLTKLETENEDLKTRLGQSGPLPVLGEIRAFAGTKVPEGWAACDGQTLNRNAYNGLFAVLGLTYGNSNNFNFRVPDLRGRTIIHHGAGSGLSNRALGAVGGSEDVLLKKSEMPVHNHPVTASGPSSKTLLKAGTPKKGLNLNIPDGTPLTSNVGGGNAHNNMPPFVALKYIICIHNDHCRAP